MGNARAASSGEVSSTLNSNPCRVPALRGAGPSWQQVRASLPLHCQWQLAIGNEFDSIRMGEIGIPCIWEGWYTKLARWLAHDLWETRRL
jgi:hypothetical protein